MTRKVKILDAKKARRENMAVPEIEARRKPEDKTTEKKKAEVYSTQSLSIVDPEILSTLCFAFSSEQEVVEHRTARACKLAEEVLRTILNDIHEILLVYPEQSTMLYSFTSAIPEDVREMVFATLHELHWRYNLDGDDLIIVLPEIQSAIVVKKVQPSRKSAL